MILVVDPSDFVVNQNRKHHRPKWWACPTRRPVKLERLLSQGERGFAIYGFWCALVGELASRLTYPCSAEQQSDRWKLVDGDGKPESIDDLAFRLRGSPEFASEAVSELVKMGWLSWIDGPEIGPKTGQPVATSESTSDPASEVASETRYVRNVTRRISVATQPRAAGAADSFVWFVDFWNEHAGKVLPKIRGLNATRKRGVKAMLADASKLVGPESAQEAVCRAIAAFASWEWAKDKKLSVDTLLRSQGRMKYLEWGQDGPPTERNGAQRLQDNNRAAMAEWMNGEPNARD